MSFDTQALDQASIARSSAISSAAVDAPEIGLTARKAMRKDLASWAAGLLLLGVVHIVLGSSVGVFAPQWGWVLLVIGALALLIRHRAMFIIIGLSLWVAGLANFLGHGGATWSALGLYQLYLGFREMRKFGRYARV